MGDVGRMEKMKEENRVYTSDGETAIIGTKWS